MNKYLTGQFSCLGIPKSKRSILEKDFLKETTKLEISEIMNITENLYKKSER